MTEIIVYGLIFIIYLRKGIKVIKRLTGINSGEISQALKITKVDTSTELNINLGNSADDPALILEQKDFNREQPQTITRQRLELLESLEIPARDYTLEIEQKGSQGRRPQIITKRHLALLDSLEGEGIKK